MGSKSSNTVVTTETVDNSAINGLASVRGDGNKVRCPKRNYQYHRLIKQRDNNSDNQATKQRHRSAGDFVGRVGVGWLYGL